MPRSKGNHRHGHAPKGKPTPEYRCWATMLQRCTNPNNPKFEDYNVRGIEDERWYTFENFLADMGLRPSPDHSIDRIDNSRGYFPANCRWATRSEQMFNRRPMTEATKQKLAEHARNRDRHPRTIGDRPMTGAERQRRYRLHKAQRSS